MRYNRFYLWILSKKSIFQILSDYAQTLSLHQIFDDENNNWFYASLSDGFSIRSECK